MMKAASKASKQGKVADGRIRTCARCDRPTKTKYGHTADECYCRTTHHGDPLPPRCKTCKQEGHTAKDCGKGDQVHPQAAVAALPQAGVYVIECNAPGFYYVGASENTPNRTAQHRGGRSTSSAWIKIHGGVKAVHPPLEPHNPALDAWEQAETMNRMLKHGVDKVRGWEITNTGPLSADDLKLIRILIFGKHQLCRTCGHDGHFAAECKRGAAKNRWLADIERRLAKLQPALSQHAEPTLERTATFSSGPSLAELTGGSEGRAGGSAPQRKHAKTAAARARRQCAQCDADISAMPKTYKKCGPCFKERGGGARQTAAATGAPQRKRAKTAGSDAPPVR